MFVFLSYNHKDQEIVEPIAVQLKNLLGQDNVFFDSWSIQPGEGIIDKMNQGLDKTDYFFFFVSRNSLESNMVKLEWQNAIYKASNNKCKFIPIKIDDCVMPAIMLQNLYIDFYNNGIDVGFSQMIDVLNGINTFHEKNITFKNVVCFQKKISDSEYVFEFSATRFVEHSSRFLILFKESLNNVEFKLLSDSMHIGGEKADLSLNNGTKWNGFFVAVTRSITPKLPLRIQLKTKDGSPFNSFLALHSDSEEGYKQIPLINKY